MARRLVPAGSALVEAVKRTPLGLKQQRSLARSNRRVNLWHGSIRAGKTYVSFLRFLAAVALYEGAGSMVIIGRTRDSLYRNLFEPIQMDPSLAFLKTAVKYREGAAHAMILGIRVNVLGANDADSETVIRGMTVGLAYGDEVTVWHGNAFRTLLGRMSPPEAQLFATTNPDNPSHWLMKDYLSKLDQHPDWYVVHFTMADNPGLTPGYIRFIRNSYSGLWWRRFGLGLWVAAEGAIYAEWDERRHVIPWSQLPRLQRLLALGIDYGTTNPTAAILLGITAETDVYGRPTPRLVLVDEWRYDSKEHGEQRLTPSAQARLLTAWLRRTPHLPQQDELEPEFVFVDPAAAEFSETLAQDHGITVWGADNAVKVGIQDVANLIASGRLIATDRCKGWISEAPGYVWDPKQVAKGEDVPLKENDHSADAVRYAVRSSRGVWSSILLEAYGAVSLSVAA